MVNAASERRTDELGRDGMLRDERKSHEGKASPCGACGDHVLMNR